MTESDDKLIAKFLREHKAEVRDNHFSKQVLKSLPGRERKLSRRWALICSLCGIVLFFVLGGAGVLVEMIYALLTSNTLALLKQTDPVQLAIAFTILVTLGIKRVCSLE